MWRVTWRGIWARRRRFLVTALAIAAGVGFLVGTRLIGVTLTDAAGGLIDDTFGQVDVVVRSTQIQSSGFGATDRRTVPGSLVPAVAQVDGVAAASGIVQSFVSLVGADGSLVGAGLSAPTVMLSVPADPALDGTGYLSGRRPRSPSEIAVDGRTVTDEGFALGDTIRLQSKQGLEPFTLVGVTGIAGKATGVLGAHTVAVVDSRAQEIAGMPGQFSYISVATAPGVDPERVVTGLAGVLPPDVEALTGTEFVAETQAQAASVLSVITNFVSFFGQVGLLVGALLISNTFSILVTQRTSELALLRATGADRSQILWSIVAEGVVVGAVGALTGCVAGVGLATAVNGVLGRFVTLPRTSPPLRPMVLVAAIALGVVMSVGSCLGPAWRATRVSPVLAMSEGALDRSNLSVARRVIGAVLGMAALVLTTLPLLFRWQRGAAVMGAAAALAFATVAVLGPTIVVPLVRQMRRPLSRLMGVPGTLAATNAARNPRRTAATAVSLTLGVGLVSAIAVVAFSLRVSVREAVSTSVRADLVIGNPAGDLRQGMPTGVYREVLDADGVAAASRFRGMAATLVDGNAPAVTGAPVGASTFVVGVDAVPFLGMVDLGRTEGSPATLAAPGTVLAERGVAEELGWRVGENVEIWFPQTGYQTFVLGATFTNGGIGGQVLVNMTSFEANSQAASLTDPFVFVRLRPSADPDEVSSRLERIVHRYVVGAQVSDVRRFVTDRTATFAAVLNLVYVLLGFAVVISLFGIANTLNLSIAERVRELGMLRAVGAQRGQLRRAVAAESALIAVVGTVIGVAIGVVYGVCLTLLTRTSGQGVHPHVPWWQLGLVSVVAILAGVVAGIGPARRASRVAIAEALAAP